MRSASPGFTSGAASLGLRKQQSELKLFVNPLCGREGGGNKPGELSLLHGTVQKVQTSQTAQIYN